MVQILGEQNLTFREEDLKKDVAVAKSKVGLLLLTSDVDKPFNTSRQVSPKKNQKLNLEETQE